MRFLLSFIFSLYLVFFAAGQDQQKKKTSEAESIFMVYPSIGFQIPGGDMADRFGLSSTVGPGFQHKTKSNWLIGADLNFVFGNKINEDSLIQNLLTVDGFVISDQGQVANVSFFERGFYAMARVGKIIPVFGSNPNSGLMLTAGAGFLQHRIHIAVEENMVAALRDDYKKGYDRLTNGFSTSQFIGYLHLGESKLANFFIGFEFVQAFTQSRRSMNFDTMQRDDAKRLDMLYGIKAGWIIPFRNRMAKDHFYY
ncbi:MAG: hypothetical protein IH598_10355 [Bacteroidales bacterium]|nr:hypothetical protein [Bacteroidales bacterium]